jgi:hypothetical protein
MRLRTKPNGPINYCMMITGKYTGKVNVARLPVPIQKKIVMLAAAFLGNPGNRMHTGRGNRGKYVSRDQQDLGR